MGLYDEFLIKENHIEALGGIREAILAVKALDMDKPIIVEVRDIPQFEIAKALGVTRIMLDNFTDTMIEEVIALNQIQPCPLEVSGGMDVQRIKNLAHLGIDFISVGSLTKSVTAIDLSLLVE